MRTPRLELLIIVMAAVAVAVAAQNKARPVSILNNPSVPFTNDVTIVESITFSGQSALSDDEMGESVRSGKAGIRAGDFFSGVKVRQAVIVLRERLRSLGYRDARVTAVGRELSKDSMALEFVVEQGRRRLVSSLEFEGNNKVATELLDANFKGCIEDGWQIYDAKRYDFIVNKCTRRFLQAHGFLTADIRTAEPLPNGDDLKVRILIKEGPRFRVGEVSFSGAKLLKENELREMLGLETGDIARLDTILGFCLDDLKVRYENAGYQNFYCDYEPALIYPPSTDGDGIVDLRFQIQEGRRFRLGRIEFKGVEADEAASLRPLFEIRDGDVFSRRLIEDGLRRMNETEKFKRVFYDGVGIEVYLQGAPVEQESNRGSEVALPFQSPGESPNEGTAVIRVKLERVKK